MQPIMEPLKVINNTGRVIVCVRVCTPQGPRKTDVLYIHTTRCVYSFPLHLHEHTQQHAFSCTYLHSGTRSRVMWPALESPLSSLCSASHAVTLRHTMCGCSLLLRHICTHTHTRCVGFVWVEKVENNDGFSCLSGRSHQDVCVRAPVCLWVSSVLMHFYTKVSTFFFYTLLSFT